MLTSILQGLSPQLVTELWLDFEDTQQYQKGAFTEISGLEVFDKLEKLSLAGHEISSLENFPKLDSLIYLDLSHNQIHDTGSLHQADSLRYLDLSYNEIKEIGFLNHFKELQHLNLGHNHLDSLAKGLSNLIQLQWLNISGQYHRKLSQMEDIALLQNLNTFFAAHIPLQSIQFLNKLPLIEKLSITPHYSCDLSPFHQLQNLNDLSIGAKFLNGELHLPPLPQVKTLRIQQGNISKGEYLRGIEFCTKLETLHLIALDLESLPDLSQCQKLETLILKSNRLPEITSLMDLPKLRTLDIRQNPLDGEKLKAFLVEKPGLEVIY
ncbi:MAG: leucine-rich repeat domain-containing protein [Bacteroidia bacterium]|nr:leucine-rich repeat domain-containing protein [Bacteroidia bacterium]